MNNAEQEINSKLQNAVRKAIANEYIAGQLYMLWNMSMPADQRAFTSDVFPSIAQSRIQGHMHDLIEWCCRNGYDIPCTDPEMKRSASDTARKMISATRRTKTAEECVKLAIKFEQKMLLEYRAAIEIDGVQEYPELQASLWNIYYDVESYVDKMSTMLLVLNANASLVF